MVLIKSTEQGFSAKNIHFTCLYSPLRIAVQGCSACLPSDNCFNYTSFNYTGFTAVWLLCFCCNRCVNHPLHQADRQILISFILQKQ